MTFLERFWSRVDMNGPVMPGMTTPCWVWTASRSDRGYGRVGIRHTAHEAAHRLSWMLHHKLPIPAGLVVCHRCDNPPCVREDHLLARTQRFNLLDMEAKGRSRHIGPRYKVMVTIDGETLTLRAWSLRKGISRQAINFRLRHGWTPVDAITTPVGPWRRSA